MIRLHHMLDHAKEAVALIAGKGRAELQHDRVLELALIQTGWDCRWSICKSEFWDPSKASLDSLAPGDRHAQPVNSRLWLRRFGCFVGYYRDRSATPYYGNRENYGPSRCKINMFCRLLVNAPGLFGVNNIVIYDLIYQPSANRFNEKTPSKPATGLGTFSLLDIKRSLNLA